MRGIITAAGYLPHHRLDRSAIKEFFGSGGGKGNRTVASYDEDTTTLAVEAGRLALRDAGGTASPRALWFATSSPTYLDKTNAAIIHAALRLDRDAAAFDLGGAVRSGIGALRAALRSAEPCVLVAAADIRVGNPTSADEAAGGDAANALLVGDETAGPVIAELIGTGSATREFLDTWKAPGEPSVRHWEERFAETQYAPLAADAWAAALKDAGVTAEQVNALVVTGAHARAVKSTTRKLGTGVGAVADDLAATVGQTGTADAGLRLAAALETAEPGQVIALVSLADGVDVLVFRTTDAIAAWQPSRPIAAQVAGGNTSLPYAKFLSWRGAVTVQPPNRPLPNRMSASAAGRSEEWKYGFVGSRDRATGAVHLPPARVSFDGGNVDDMEPLPMADAIGTVMTFTVDRLAYSPSPPVVFAVVDFEGGGRLPLELTDTTPDEVEIDGKVEMTFRRLNTADGIANYFWKARPVR
jgi:3-hydroxy-3-methylglutaryl CoA synthase/uncharacterized OB-fold protein